MPALKPTAPKTCCRCFQG